MLNPNPKCEKDCRFVHGSSMITAMYFHPVYDKHGNNLNPDGNTSTTEVRCTVCSRSWIGKTQYGVSEFTEIEK